MGCFLLQAIRCKISLIQTAVPADDYKVMGKIRTAKIEKPLKVKTFATGLEILIKVYYTVATVKES
jgi:hypothetical protein